MKFKLLPKLFLLLLSIPILFTSCKDIIEPSISKRGVTLQAPVNAYQSNSYKTNFWWDPVEDALTYRLQIVTPKFDSVAALIMDTIVKKNVFAVNLSPGKYQWRVMALNGSSQTVYSSIRSFIIQQSSIKQQSVQLLSPANNKLTNQASISFQWGDLYGATKYRLEIDTNNFINETAVIYNQATPGQQINFTFPKDQIYQWRVRAENDTAQAKWSPINIVTYDHTPPALVSITGPDNDKTVTLPVALQWGTVATASQYKLYMYKSDSTTPYSARFPLLLNTNSYNFNLGSSGDRVYWKISAFDAAGNEGQATVLRSFVLQ
ncbi:hypothetical protein BH09BAC6_BH09BAC6_28330 [soil metagenome]